MVDDFGIWRAGWSSLDIEGLKLSVFPLEVYGVVASGFEAFNGAVFPAVGEGGEEVEATGV